MPTFTPTSELYPSETVTIVIPAYNEDPCMGAGLSAVCGADLVSQIIYGWTTGWAERA